ncbi:hypothetical protein [Gemmatirosa kalamazoonensis]|uniref:hypothetical protein n=1 Tax=Gemmatirosa kalamazoonensis TaxID=861299 RepID=UPI0011DD1249|nr:hypothetical protein [Gemmatirosa kalamazoonensis]
MTGLRTARLAVVAAAVVALGACDDASRTQLSPSIPSLSSSSTAVRVATVQRRTPLGDDVTRRVVVDRNGAVIRLDAAGLKVKVPSNALPAGTESLEITVTAIAGSQFAYEFEPSGATFTRPLEIEQDIRDAVVDGHDGGSPIVSYFKTRSDVDAAAGTANSFEDLNTSMDVRGHKLRTDIWHFSGYIVSWGRH